MFGFLKGEKRIEGDIGYYQLEDWWLGTFDTQQREYIIQKYQPYGLPPRSLVERKYEYSSASKGAFLSGLGSWFMSSNDRDIGRTILAKAKEECLNSGDPLDMHFALQHLIETYYRDRDREDFYEKAIGFCKEQIKMQAAAAAEFKSEYPDQPLPAHVGYWQYAVILEKEKKYDEAITLSREANKNGWAGDWENRIERCKKRKAKAS